MNKRKKKLLKKKGFKVGSAEDFLNDAYPEDKALKSMNSFSKSDVLNDTIERFYKK